MSYPVRSIPCKRWRHKTTGQKASVYGACPFTGAKGNTRDDWEVVVIGWTVENSDGTVGIGRVPWATKEDADAYIESVKRR